MYYDLSDLGHYYTAYSADFAAKTHARAYSRWVLMNIFDENHTTIGKRIYYPNGKIEVIF